MIIQIKEKDSPIREISLDQAKFEFRNKIISSSALYWKEGMKEWERLDQMPEIKEITTQSPKEDRLGENWLYRQINARRHFFGNPEPVSGKGNSEKRKWVRVLSFTGIILAYLFVCVSFFGSSIDRNANDNPLPGVIVGLILLRRIYRLQAEKTLAKKPDSSFLGFYFKASAWSFIKWFIYLIPVYIFAVLDAETSSQFGTNLGLCFGLYICTIPLSLDTPIWTWLKRKEYAEAGYPPKNMAWAIAGGIAIPLFAIGLVTLVIPAFKNSLERAKIVSEAAEVSKTAEAQTNATPAPWSPPAEELIDPQTADSGTPTETAVSQKVYGKSKAYSLILPPEWEVTNDIPEHDFTASNEGLNFEVIYQPKSSRTASELLDIIKRRLQKNGAVDITSPFTRVFNNIKWLGVSSTLLFRGKKSGSMTCMVYKSDKGAFILMFGSALQPENVTRQFFDPIINSFNIE